VVVVVVVVIYLHEKPVEENSKRYEDLNYNYTLRGVDISKLTFQLTKQITATTHTSNYITDEAADSSIYI